MRFFFVLALAALVSGSPMAAAAPENTAAPAALPAPACTWFDEYARTLTDLREDFSAWTVDPIQPSLGGQPMEAVTSDDGAVVVWQGTPCPIVADVVRHEHMHRLQVAEYGSLGSAAEALADGGRDRLEITADCASVLAGSKYTPYVRLAGGCSEADLRDARALLK